MCKIKEIIKKIRFYANTKWDIKDLCINIEEITPLIDSPLNKDNYTYTCFRNRQGYCVYVPTKYQEKFFENNDIYNKDYNLINISELRRHKVKRSIKTDVYTNVSPAIVKVKYIETVDIHNIKIYLVYSTDLDYEDDAYKDLVNYNRIKGMY